MADYYTRFSVVLQLDATQKEYALDLANKAESHRNEDEPLPSDFPADLKDVLEEWSFETEKDEEGLWLNSENGGIDAVCAFIQHLLQKFDPQGRVSFEWANDCSKPLTDAYGGGAAVITAKEIKVMSTYEWLQSQGV